MALFTNQGSGGLRLVTASEGDSSASLSGVELKGELKYDPVPIWPLGIGAYASWISVSGSGHPGSIRGFDLGIVGEFWYPLRRPTIAPYLKIGMPIFAFQSHGDGLVQSSDSVSGAFVGGGLRYMLFFRTGVMLEVNREQRRQGDDNGTTQLAATSVLLGFQSGL